MSYKPTKRKAFNFLRSYFDVYNKLKNDKDKLKFIELIMEKQFLDQDPDESELSFAVDLAYASQKHSIEQSVKGYKSKTKDPMEDPCQGGIKGGRVQEEEKEKEEEQEQEKEEDKLVLPFDSLEFKKAWENWKVYKKKEFNFNFISLQSQQASLSKLNNISEGNENIAIKIIHQSMSNGWKGFFKLKKENNEKRNSSQSGVQYSDAFKERLLKKLHS